MVQSEFDLASGVWSKGELTCAYGTLFVFELASKLRGSCSWPTLFVRDEFKLVSKLRGVLKREKVQARINQRREKIRSIGLEGSDSS